MLERISILAEQQATRLGRRAFIEKAARAAVPVAAMLTGLFGLSRDAYAVGRRKDSCCYGDVPGGVCKVRDDQDCPSGATSRSQCPQFGRKPGPCY